MRQTAKVVLLPRDLSPLASLTVTVPIYALRRPAGYAQILCHRLPRRPQERCIDLAFHQQCICTGRCILLAAFPPWCADAASSSANFVPRVVATSDWTFTLESPPPMKLLRRGL